MKLPITWRLRALASRLLCRHLSPSFRLASPLQPSKSGSTEATVWIQASCSCGWQHVAAVRVDTAQVQAEAIRPLLSVKAWEGRPS